MSYARILVIFIGGIIHGACSSVETSEQELESIKSHMAEMESFSNALFRDIDDPRYKDETLIHLKNLRAGLLASMKQVPEFILSDNLATSQRKQLIEGYRKRAQLADDIIVTMIAKIENEEFSEAKELLLKLDQVRRDCHSEYGY